MLNLTASAVKAETGLQLPNSAPSPDLQHCLQSQQISWGKDAKVQFRKFFCFCWHSGRGHILSFHSQPGIPTSCSNTRWPKDNGAASQDHWGWKTPLGSSHPTCDWSPPWHPNHSTRCRIQECTQGKTGTEQILSRGPQALRSLTVTSQFEFLSAKLTCFNHQPNSTRALSSRAMRCHRVCSQHTTPLCRISLNQAPLCT